MRVFGKKIEILEGTREGVGPSLKVRLMDRREVGAKDKTFGSTVATSEELVRHHHIAPRVGMTREAKVPTTNGSRVVSLTGRDVLVESFLIDDAREDSTVQQYHLGASGVGVVVVIDGA